MSSICEMVVILSGPKCANTYSRSLEKLRVVVMNTGPLYIKTSYRQISWGLEGRRLHVIMIVSLWNLTGISTALLSRCLSNSREIRKVMIQISRLRDFTTSCGKTSRLRIPGWYRWIVYIPLRIHLTAIFFHNHPNAYEATVRKMGRLIHPEQNHDKKPQQNRAHTLWQSLYIWNTRNQLQPLYVHVCREGL